jgi:tRNA(Ile)-lysidine synthase
MRSRLIRKAIQSVKGDLNGIEEKHINSVLKLFKTAQTGTILNLPSELVVMVTYEDLIITHGEKVPVSLPTVELKLGKSWIPDWGLEIELEVIEPTTGRYPIGNNVVLDADKLKGPLLLRQRMEGDRFSPIGLNGSKKLKDYFIDKKIPRHDRDIVPILTDSEGIVWVAGHSIDQRCRLGKDTKRALKICCKKTDNI